jgi:excisionase family DNA binding protein
LHYDEFSDIAERRGEANMKAPAVEIPETMSIDTLAAKLGVSAWTVRTWLRQGRIAYYKVGRRCLVRVEDVERLLEQTYRPAVRATTNGT